MNKLKKLSDHLYCLPFEQYSDRPNLYYIKGRDYSIAVDAGNSKRHCQLFYDELISNNLALPTYTLISHWHWDHTFGLCGINGGSISSLKTQEKLSQVERWKWDLASMRQREKTGEDIAFCNDNIIREYPNLNDIVVRTTDIALNKNTTMDLGDIKVELLLAVSTHSDDALYVYLPSQRALIVQDSDCEDFYDGGKYDKEKLSKMIAFFENIKYKDHYLGHAQKESKQEALKRLYEARNRL